LFGQTAPKFQAICEENQIPFVVVSTLHEAVQESYRYAKDHHIELVLFSPGAASFDMFKNVYDRVGQFVHEVSLLK
jgi:UDP-N-acetylmuramoylalanine--D-glutamate ligase